MATVPLPAELVEIVRGQLHRLPELADQLASLLGEKDEFYRRLDASSPRELRKVCEVNLGRAFDAFIEARAVDLEMVRKTGDVEATARRFSVTIPWARMACLEHHVELPPPLASRPMRESTLAIIAELIAGTRACELTRKFGVSRQRISEIKHKAMRVNLIKA